MIKYCIYIVLVLTFFSCRSYQMLDGKSRPVYFTPDASVFNDSDFNHPTIYYQDLQNLRGNSGNTIELKKGATSIAIIHQPTFFSAYDEFLVYPGEHIIIKKGKYNDYTFSAIHGSKRRNRELSFFQTMAQIESYPKFPYVSNASLDKILDIERKREIEILQFKTESQQLFDSLAKAFRVTKRFKKIAGDYVENKSKNINYGIYKYFKDTLEAHGLYKEKLKQLIPAFNAVTEKSKFEGITESFNEIADEILPYKIWRIANETEFKSCFDSIETNFTALSKDYLLSRLMYRAYTKRIPISSVYTAKYESGCSDKIYKKIVNNIKSQQEENDNKTIAIGNNSLLSVDGKEVSSLENILSKHKGKLVLIDFWASWCAPCREEMPYLRKLLQEYSKKNYVVKEVFL